MDMTREALKYIAEMGEANVIDIHGESYTDTCP